LTKQPLAYFRKYALSFHSVAVKRLPILYIFINAWTVVVPALSEFHSRSLLMHNFLKNAFIAMKTLVGDLSLFMHGIVHNSPLVNR
jgi:hypothetical protein